MAHHVLPFYSRRNNRGSISTVQIELRSLSLCLSSNSPGLSLFAESASLNSSWLYEVFGQRATYSLRDTNEMNNVIFSGLPPGSIELRSKKVNAQDSDSDTV